MTNESQGATVTPITLGEALSEYLSTLNPAQRHEQEAYVRKYVEHADPSMIAANLSGSRVEATPKADPQRRPNAQRRVEALKAWFQSQEEELHVREYGINVRVKRTGGRAGAAAVRLKKPPSR